MSSRFDFRSIHACAIAVARGVSSADAADRCGTRFFPGPAREREFAAAALASGQAVRPVGMGRSGRGA